MNLSGFEVKPCRSGMAFDVLPRQAMKVDLAKACQRFREKGFAVEAETPVVAMVRVKGKPVSVYASGRLQVRQTRALEEARAIATEIVRLL